MLCFDLVQCAALAAAFSAGLTRHTYRCKEQHASLHKQVQRHLCNSHKVQAARCAKRRMFEPFAATWSFQIAAANSATVFGDAGRLEVPDSHAPSELTIIEVK